MIWFTLYPGIKNDEKWHVNRYGDELSKQLKLKYSIDHILFCTGQQCELDNTILPILTTKI